MTLTPDQIAEILVLHTKWINSESGGQRADLTSANLYGASLFGANLYGADLYGADLRSANLTSANLYGASLYGANLFGANLYGASLYGANLFGANLYGADLTSANLRSADLRSANLRSANLTSANLGCVSAIGARLKILGACIESIAWADSESIKVSALKTPLITMIKSARPEWSAWLLDRLGAPKETSPRDLAARFIAVTDFLRAGATIPQIGGR